MRRIDLDSGSGMPLFGVGSTCNYSMDSMVAIRVTIEADKKQDCSRRYVVTVHLRADVVLSGFHGRSLQVKPNGPAGSPRMSESCVSSASSEAACCGFP